MTPTTLPVGLADPDGVLEVRPLSRCSPGATCTHPRQSTMSHATVLGVWSQSTQLCHSFQCTRHLAEMCAGMCASCRSEMGTARAGVQMLPCCNLQTATSVHHESYECCQRVASLNTALPLLSVQLKDILLSLDELDSCLLTSRRSPEQQI